MIEVTIDSIRVSLMSHHRIVVLKEDDGERMLPIWIGPFEADAITIQLENTTFFAQIVIEMDGETIEIDSRPSDAIALAVRVDAPIYVSEDVMEQACVQPGEEMSLSDQEEEMREIEDASPEDLGVFKDLIEGLDLDNPLS